MPTTLFASLALSAVPLRTYAAQDEGIEPEQQEAPADNIVTLDIGSASITLTGPVTTRVGEQFQVGVALSAITDGVKAGKFTIEYNAALFDYVWPAQQAARHKLSVKMMSLKKVAIVTVAPGEALTDGEQVLLSYRHRQSKRRREQH